MPDVRMEPVYFGKFTLILAASGYIDDFANRYAVTHTPTRQLVIDDSTYARFCRSMQGRTLNFESGTERMLGQLKRMAEREKYAERIAPELEAIAKKIQDDQQAELQTFAEEIREVMADAVITRWYYDAGRLEFLLRRDDWVKRAADILLNRSEYTRILTLQDTERK